MRRLALLLLCSAAYAQTVSPVIVECGLKCSGQFTITNNTTKPLVATVTPYSFTVKNKHVTLAPVDSANKVLLDATSARISPLGSHVFTYKIFCAADPCRTQLLTGFMVGRSAIGLDVWEKIPHSVYSCKKQKGCRKYALEQ